MVAKQLTGRGALDLAPTLIRVDGATATVHDCYTDNTGVYDATTGARKDKPSTARDEVVATLVLDIGVWKVSDLKKVGEGCVPA